MMEGYEPDAKRARLSYSGNGPPSMPVPGHRLSHPETAHGGYTSQPPGPPTNAPWAPPTSSPFAPMNDHRGPPPSEHMPVQTLPPPPPPPPSQQQHHHHHHHSVPPPPPTPQQQQHIPPPHANYGPPSSRDGGPEHYGPAPNLPMPTQSPAPSYPAPQPNYQPVNGAPPEGIHPVHSGPPPPPSYQSSHPPPPQPPHHSSPHHPPHHHHSPHHPSPHQPPEHRPSYDGPESMRHDSVPNGVHMMPQHRHDDIPASQPPPLQHPPAPSQYQHPPPSGPPPMPQSAPPPQPHYSHDPYQMQYSNSQYGQRVRRPARAQQACDACRHRKARCDEGRPSCGNCRETGVPCVYKDIPPAKQEKAAQATMERLDQLYNQISGIEGIKEEQQDQRRALDKQRELLERILAQMAGGGSASRFASEPLDLKRKFEDDSRAPYADMRGPRQEGSIVPAPGAFNSAPHGGLMQTSDNAFTIPRQYLGGEDEGENPASKDGESSIPSGHTTAARWLLEWPSIKRLFRIPKLPDFVMELSEQTGLILIYGQGRSATDRSAAHFEVRHEYSPEDNLTGRGFDQGRFLDSLGFQKSPVLRQSGFLTEGGLTKDGVLDFDPNLIDELTDKFIHHIHTLHPILTDYKLLTNMDRFKSLYSTDRNIQSLLVNLHDQGGTPVATYLPKKHSNRTQASRSGHTSHANDSPSAMQAKLLPVPQQPVLVDRTLDNAVSLLVLAIGKACARNGDLSGPAGRRPKPFSHALNAATQSEGKPSPVPSHVGMPSAGSNAISPMAINAMSPGAGSVTSNRSSSTSNSVDPSTPSNIPEDICPPEEANYRYNAEVMSGLAYFALASSILADFEGSTELTYAQASLLAALYIAQFGEFGASHAWISKACRTCWALVHRRRFKQQITNYRKDTIRFVYWTCLQLESDILAELDLPQSGMAKWDETIRPPQGLNFAPGMPTCNDDIPGISKDIQVSGRDSKKDLIWLKLYWNQVYLRKLLNRVHNSLYNPEGGRFSFLEQEALLTNLSNWKVQLPENLQWEDTDEPAADINVARLRAKYYGARYVICRPILHHALHPNAQALDMTGASESNHQPEPWAPHLSMAPPHMSTTFHAPSGSLRLGDLSEKQLRACELCVRSAIQSTIAFDGVVKRVGKLTVTNIFGTAHAQFGNMLVLCAVYRSNLSELISSAEVESLLDRTVKFLNHHRYCSTALAEDARILQELKDTIFGPGGTDSTARKMNGTPRAAPTSANTSFSSANGY